jgi:2-polyprenyl-3-methyl-5-hydroxy-6-metoxy-1,4-benzoquinol methylase
VSRPRYDVVAESYGAGADDYSVSATRALLEMADAVSGLRVLDLACGHGPIAREMARRGAIVVGVDLSNGLLERARITEAAHPLGIEYLLADVASSDTLMGEVFDVVVCNFGLSDIDDLDGVCATVARVLRAGGRFVASILHPCFPGVADVSGSWRTGGRYYDEEWWLADGELSVLRRFVGANHRMLSTYVNTFAEHGLAVEKLMEPHRTSRG